MNKSQFNIAVLIGTRPGIIKMSVVYHAVQKSEAKSILIHSGQHYSDTMDQKIMADVELPKPDYRFLRPNDCISHANQTAFMLVNIEKALIDSKADLILVCGDANTNLAGALAGRKLGIAVGHVEAGLRSYDWRMPEEHNRRMIDHISDLLFAPTEECSQILKTENVAGKIFCVGNTIADAALRFCPDGDLKVKKAILTMHREENVDDPRILSHLLNEVDKIRQYYGRPIEFLMHPRTRKRIDKNNLWSSIPANIIVQETVPYREMLKRIREAEFVITDSGGLQEEACILGTPCFTLRKSTERPETLKCGSNIVLGIKEPSSIFKENWPFSLAKWKSPFGDGSASEAIVRHSIVWLSKNNGGFKD